MSERIQGLSIGLGLDSAGLDASLKQMRSKLSLVNSEMKVNMSAFDRGEKSVQKYQTQITGLNRKLDVQKAAVATARREYEQMVLQHGEGSVQAERAARAYNDLAGDLNNLERHVESLTDEMRRFEEHQRVTESGMYRFGQSMTDIGGRMTKLGDGMKNVGKSMSMYVTAPIVGIGAAATKLGMDFDDTMAKVQAISGATGGDLELLRDKAKEMGATTKFSASEAAEGLTFMAMAGWKTEDMLSGLPGIMSLAAASGEELGMVSDIVTDALTAFGLTAQDSGKFADVLAAASSNANTNVSMLGASFKYVAPVAGALGMSVEDSALALGLMANAGIKADQSGTALRTMLTNLAKPTKQMQGAMDELGISLTNQDGSMKTLDEVMHNLRDSFTGLTKDQQASSAAAIFGKEAMSGALSIINATQSDYDKLAGAIRNSNGAADEMAKTMGATLGGTWREIRSAMEGFMIDLYEQMRPALIEVSEHIKSFANWLGALSPQAKMAAITIGGIAAAIGPLLVVTGTLVSSLGSIITFIGSAVTAVKIAGTTVAAATPLIGGLSTAFTFLTGPIGLTIAGLAALTAGGIALGKYLSGDALEEVDLFGEGIEGVSDSTTKALESFWELGDGVDDALMEMRVSGDGLTKEYAETIVGNFESMNEQILTAMNENYEEQKTAMLGMFEGTRYLTDEERAGILSRLDTHHTLEKEKQQAQMDRIYEIEEAAFAEQRKLTEGEQIEINAIKTQMQNEAVEQLSESAIEEAAIRQRLKDTSERITTEQGVELIKRSAEHRDEKIRIAEDEYDKSIAALESAFYDQGIITEEEYKTLLQKAKDQRDDQVEEANGMHVDIVAETTAGNKEVERLMDVHTGEMLSRWDYLSRESTKKVANLAATGVTEWTKYKNGALDLLTIMSRDGTKYISGMVDAAAAMPGKMARGIKAASGAATSAVIAMGNDMLRKFGGVVNALILGVNSITSKLGIKANISLWSVPTIPGGGSGRSSARPVAAYHAGTDGHPGGAMVVGDRYGRELVQFPDGRMWMSPDTDTLVPDAPKGTRVIPNKLTEKLVKGEIPMYANGIGVVDAIRGIATGGAKAASWLSNVWDYASNPKKLIDLMVSRLGLSITGLSGGMADLAKGAFGTVKDKSIDYIKEMFKKAGDVTGGSFGPGFRLTSRAGWRIHPIYGDRRFHYGDDWGAAAGTNIKSMSSGIVKSARREGARGNTVRVQSGPYELIYQHNSRNNVRGGQSVTKGQSIGAVGSTGDSTGPHLHFETWKNGSFVHPKSLGFKTGAVFNGPTAGLMAEDGHPEVLIPTDPKRRTDAMKLLAVVGKMLGADGGNATRPNQLPPLPGGQGNSVLEELLAATLNQNQILMQLLNKNSDVYLDTGVLAGAMTPEVSRNQGSSYELNRLMRGR